MVSKRNFLFWTLLFRFHVKFLGCIDRYECISFVCIAPLTQVTVQSVGKGMAPAGTSESGCSSRWITIPGSSTVDPRYVFLLHLNHKWWWLTIDDLFSQKQIIVNHPHLKISICSLRSPETLAATIWFMRSAEVIEEYIESNIVLSHPNPPEVKVLTFSLSSNCKRK